MCIRDRVGLRRRRGLVRYIAFAASLLFVSALFLFGVQGKAEVMWYAFWAGNGLYYACLLYTSRCV